MDSLVTLIARQSELKFLNLGYNRFTEEQYQKIRSAVANTSCRVIITKEEYKAWKAEQMEKHLNANHDQYIIHLEQMRQPCVKAPIFVGHLSSTKI